MLGQHHQPGEQGVQLGLGRRTELIDAARGRQETEAEGRRRDDRSDRLAAEHHVRQGVVGGHPEQHVCIGEAEIKIDQQRLQAHFRQ